MHSREAPLPLIRLLAAALVPLFAAATFVVLKSGGDAIGLALWATSPQLVPLGMLLWAREPWVAWTAATILMLFWAAAAAAWLAGGLGVLFLPIVELASMAALFLILWLVSATWLAATGAARLVRTNRRQRTGDAALPIGCGRSSAGPLQAATPVSGDQSGPSKLSRLAR